MCGGLELAQNLPSHKIILILGNSRVSVISTDNNLVFMVCQKLETLKETIKVL